MGVGVVLLLAGVGGSFNSCRNLRTHHCHVTEYHHAWGNWNTPLHVKSPTTVLTCTRISNYFPHNLTNIFVEKQHKLRERQAVINAVGVQ